MKHHLLNNVRQLAAMLLAALCFPVMAQEEPNVIELTFAGRGESTNVESVTVTNLSHPEIAPVTMSGTDILYLASAETITPIESVQEAKGIAQPILTPNPSLGTDGTLIFDAKSEGPVRVSIYSQSGMLMDAATLNVCKGRNTARIPSQGTGIYIINVEGQGVKSSTRWICSGSKSFSGIALGGASQWADVALPVKFLAPKRQAATNAVHEVFMEFNEGDILRFEGKSGKMRTIMHLSPETSHSVFFDFFKCEDKDGYNYPIVRIGDMLWMLEDLRPLKMSGLIKTSNANIWKSMEDMAAAEFEVDGRAYYTITGGRMAIPEGWHIPSIDEMYAFVKELKADVNVLGDFLKDRSYEDWPMMLQEGLDTLHLQLLPNGFIDQNGELTGGIDEKGKPISYEVTGAWATNNTVQHGCPVSFEISALNSKFLPSVTHEKNCAFAVRGCRIAPSVFQEMLVETFRTDTIARSSRRKLPLQKINSNGPLGEYYTYGADRASVFFDYSGNQKGGGLERRSGIIYKKNEESKWSLESKNLVPLEVNGSNPYQVLRKVAAQGNAEGYENVVYATWSRPFHVFFDGKAKDYIPATPSVMGEGVVKVTVFGDSTVNHAILSDFFDTRPLLDKDGNEYQWAMPTFNGKEKLAWYIYPGETASDLYLGDLRREYFARAFNLKCIQDQTGDGVEEIVMNVGNKIAIFNGKTFRCIRERAFADEGSYIGTTNLRYDVADVDGDGLEDIVMVVNTNDIGSLRVYSQGHIDEEPVFTKALGSKCLFCDVKVGKMTKSDLPEIAVLTRGLRDGSNIRLEKVGYLYMLRLMYDDNLKLTEEIILPKTSVDAFANNANNEFHLGNMDLVFGYFHGREYTQDLVVGDGLWRWDETKGPAFKLRLLTGTKDSFYTIAADAIAAVQARRDTRDLLTFIYNKPISNTWENGCQVMQSKFGEMWIKDNGTVGYTSTFATDLFGWGNVGPYYVDNNLETSGWYDYGAGGEINSHPVLCRFADREQARRFKFVSYDVAYSEPRIYAAIAAAPYYEDLTGSDNASTTWGKSKSEGTGSSRSDTWGGSLIVGFEHSYSAPFLSAMGAGWEFTSKISAAASIATEHEYVVTYENSYSATQEHVVVMQAMPYDVYTYEIIGSSDPDEMGTTFQVSMPRKRIFEVMGLSDYVRLTADQRGVAKPQKQLTSTPGKPFTYPMNYDNVPGIIRNNDDYPFMTAHDLNGNPNPEAVGTGSGISTRSIQIESSTTTTNSVEIGVETELVGTLMGIKAGVGFNYNNTNEHSHIIGEGFAVEGSVFGLPSDCDLKKNPKFNWNLVWYYVQDGKEIYPVVNYIVVRP